MRLKSLESWNNFQVGLKVCREMVRPIRGLLKKLLSVCEPFVRIGSSKVEGEFEFLLERFWCRTLDPRSTGSRPRLSMSCQCVKSLDNAVTLLRSSHPVHRFGLLNSAPASVTIMAGKLSSGAILQVCVPASAISFG